MVDADALQRLFALEGEVALVTGAGSGIGAGTARLLAQAGATVICADLDLAAAEAVAATLGGAGDAIAMQVDVAQEASVRSLFADVAARFGRLDLLVNNAGIYPKYDFLEIDADSWDRVQDVNLRGAYFCMRGALELMKASGRGGRIVNIASIAALHPLIFDNSHYGATKAGVLALTRAVALEFAEHGIRCNAVLPGAVATEGSARHAASGHVTRGPMAGGNRIPLGRSGAPEDIAAAVLYLASPAAAYVTGHGLVVDGGFLVS